MAEYWKSTPKYWCKFCSLYVKDTKFERQQHEATGRHQGNIQRSLKGLHREQEAQERQKQRAKNEVARLNGLVPSSSSSTAGTPVAGIKPTFTKQDEKKATLEDRKRQWNQLAAMGIALPEEARGDMAIAGEWKVVSEQVVGEVDEQGEFRPVLNKGIHKRKLDEDEEEQVAAREMITKKKGWGQTYKSFPGKNTNKDDDVEALFQKGKKAETKDEQSVDAKNEVKDEPGVKEEDAPSLLQAIPTEEEEAASTKTGRPGIAESLLKEEEDAPAPVVVFKKRKKIAR
ncbi:hypothetical protein BU26DRAFT_611585 [Trematosphaeria pertusa]|uniref:U1-type domain-containing protein n=1 Tax=Trematosphaeria pertusa TaxID=390896 RepID=A0A6A6HQU3_9PLEO|nr:uncharacterized protein BU26DRAFT_611585 [Trematosphaeria pertusa]KAF2240486.1 hypothetical protein BU26DRAFT_611585 [Trematosphaeria pertusa]